MDNMDKKTFTSSLPEEYLKLLKIVAIREDISLSDLLTKIVVEFFDNDTGAIVTPGECLMGGKN